MKKILCLLLAALTVLSCVGCGNKSETGKVELEIVISQYSSYTQKWWEAFEQSFEAENNDIDLKIEVVSWDDLYTVVNTRISTNRAPDILNIDTFADYVADDLLMSAEEYTSPALQANIHPSFWEASEVDGTVWALPILASVRPLFSNMKLLNEAGITAPPATWDEVMAASKAVYDTFGGSVVPWALDISTDEGQAAFSYYSWNNGGDFLDENGNWVLNSEENIAALNFIKTLFDSGYCNANPYNDTMYPLQDAFAAGSLAMIIAPCNLYDFAGDIDFEVSTIPTNGDREPVTMGVCDRLLVFKEEKGDQEARTAAITKFFDYFYACEKYSEYMVYEGFLPVTVDASALLSENAEKFTKGSNGQPGESEYFAMFCGLLESCRFYPAGKTEWIEVKQGVIDVEQRMCEGEDAAALINELQAKLTDK